MAQKLRGIVNRISFHNEESGFTVLRLEEENTAKNHTCVGVMPAIEQGESVCVTGEWTNDKRFGLQFSVQSYERVRPTTIEGILQFLQSGLICDIGPVRAMRIVETFGTETLNILDTEPQRLREVPGIGVKRQKTILDAWQKQQHIRDLVLFLQQYDISINLIHKIYKMYGEKAREVVTTNPYQLIEDIWGVGFKKADVIAQKIGFEKESYRRIKAGIVFTLQEASNEGHVYLPKQQLMEKAATVLDVDWEKVLFSLDQLVVEQRAIAEDNKIYLPLFFRAETICAEILDKKIRFGRNAAPTYNRESVDRWVVAYTTNVSFEPDVRQIQAIHTALSSSIMIMTGGPGTGKTTTIQVMVAFFRAHHLRIALCAPTGRAAQRMGNLAGVSARTIHRLLEYNPKKPGNPFTRNEHNPLDTDVLICDEVSMIDILLMKQLLQAIRPQTIVIFVGDNNQLPSIGPGNVLGDMIQSERIPHCVLTTIFRQAAKSRIVTAAHQIIHGSIPEFSNEKSDNCFFIQKNSPQECIASIIELVTERLPHAYSIDPVRDIQVVSPMHRGELGTLEINRILQSHLNKSTEKLTRGETSFSSGDKVMQIRNNYETEVFNGDIGYVAKILDDKGLLVDFGDKVVPYLLKDLEELVHAYCISIHKSQGCEFNTVIIPIMTQHYIMLQRNLIYTALTRARQRCIFVGTLKALSIGIANNQAQHRYCYLSQRIKRSEKIN